VVLDGGTIPSRCRLLPAKQTSNHTELSISLTVTDMPMRSSTKCDFMGSVMSREERMVPGAEDQADADITVSPDDLQCR
jgi:hypothetical protein